MTESESQVFKEWRCDKYVIGGTESGKFYQWCGWGEDQDEEGAKVPWYFWGRGLREGDVLFLAPFQVYGRAADFDTFQAVEEAFEYRDLLPPWDSTRYVVDDLAKAYDTQAGEWVTHDEMDKDTIATIEAVWGRAPLDFHIMSDGSVRPPEYWQQSCDKSVCSESS